MNRFSTFFFFFLISLSGFSQRIIGKITDIDGKPIPFASIYVQELATGTTSNIDGDYFLDLSAGNYNLQYRYLGYQTKKVSVNISENDLHMDIALAPQNYQLKEVKVLASGEDPANYVMRKAIAMGDYYTKQVSEYTNKVYLKGSGKITSVPRLFKKKLAEEGITENKRFVTENISKIHFELPDKIKEEVISIRSSDLDGDTNPMQFITANLYDTKEDGLISPLDKTAFSVYRFQLEAVFEDQGRVINRIKVIPKRKGKDLFRGYLNIADTYWNIHSADLKLSLPMTEVHMHQVFAPIKDEVWMPVSFDFDIQFSGLGFGLNMLYVAAIKDYQITLNPNLDHDYLKKLDFAKKQEEALVANMENPKSKVLSAKELKRKKEIQTLLDKGDMNNSDMRKLARLMKKDTQKPKKDTVREPLEIKIEKIKIAKDAKEKDSLYWEKMRPMPLSEEEKISFKKKDSLEIVHNSPEYKDSVRIANRKFRFSHLLFGKTYQYKESSSSFSTPGLLRIDRIQYNTVQGFTFDAPFSYSQSDTLGHSFSLSPNFTYAFSRKHLDFSMKSNYRYNGLKRSYVGFDLGSKAIDFNETTGIDPMLNTASSLYFKHNYLKLYDKNYLNIWHQTDIINGLQLTTKLEYANRKQLYNNNSFSFSGPDHRNYTPNIPNGFDPILFQNNKSFSFEAQLEFTPRHRYYIEHGVKRMSWLNKNPIFGLRYKQAIRDVLDSKASYSLLETSIHHSIETGFNDSFSYLLKAGSFLTKKNMHFSDFKHFSTGSPAVLLSSSLSIFRLLDDYRYSTNQDYLEAHAMFTSDRLLLKRLPLLNNSLAIQERVFTNYLTHKNKKNYWEVGYGLSQIFLLMDVEVVWSFDGKHHRNTGIKLIFNLN